MYRDGNENEELLWHEKVLNLINDGAKLNKYIEDYNLKKFIDKIKHEKKMELLRHEENMEKLAKEREELMLNYENQRKNDEKNNEI